MSTTLASIKTDVSTNIPAALNSVNSVLTSTSANVDSILEDTAITVPQKLDSIEGQVVTQGASAAIERETAKGVKAKILDMPKEIISGSAVAIKYKTATGLSPVIDIYKHAKYPRCSRGKNERLEFNRHL